MDTIVIQVTAAHIAAGEKGSLVSCPIAKAFQAAGYEAVDIGGAMMRAGQPDGWRIQAKTGATAKQFMERFDEGSLVTPGEIRIYSDGEGGSRACYFPRHRLQS